MTDSRVNIPDRASRFFDNYLICLAKASIPERQRRWYALRVEGVIKAQNGGKIKTLTAQDLAWIRGPTLHASIADHSYLGNLVPIMYQ